MRRRCVCFKVLRAGGFTNGGLNFDAKTRRGSYTWEDVAYAYIAGMDSFALGLRLAEKILKDGRLDAFVTERYKSYTTGIGKRIADRTATIEELEEYAKRMGDVTTNTSGRQEYLREPSELAYVLRGREYAIHTRNGCRNVRHEGGSL